MPVVAVLDADVLYPMVLRDTLLRVTAAGCFRAHWSERIVEEVMRNLTERRMDAATACSLTETMAAAFPEALVEGWEALEADMPNHPKDRHVAAAAVVAGASIIVTSNLKDFRQLPVGIVAMSPDAFLLSMLERDPQAVLDAVRAQANGYRRPPTTLAALLDWLARIVPDFAAAATDLVTKN